MLACLAAATRSKVRHALPVAAAVVPHALASARLVLGQPDDRPSSRVVLASELSDARELRPPSTSKTSHQPDHPGTHSLVRPNRTVWASLTSSDEAMTHNVTRALLGLAYVKRTHFDNVAPRYLSLREVPGAQPPDAVLGVCARGGAACPGHRLPLHWTTHAFVCCVKCGALVGDRYSRCNEVRRAAGAITGVGNPASGWRCQAVCRGPAPPRPGDPSRPRFGVFDDIKTAASDERVREALGLSASKAVRARWIGLRLDTQRDGSRLVVGVCHAHNTACGCPGHPLALRNLSDATACCAGCGREVTTRAGVQRARANGGTLHMGNIVRDDGVQEAGWLCLKCQRHERLEARRRA